MFPVEIAHLQSSHRAASKKLNYPSAKRPFLFSILSAVMNPPCQPPQITINNVSMEMLVSTGTHWLGDGKTLVTTSTPFAVFEDRTLVSLSRGFGTVASCAWLAHVSVHCECEGVPIIVRTPNDWTFPDPEKMELYFKHLILRIKPSCTTGNPESVPDVPRKPIPAMFITLTIDQVWLLETMGWIERGSLISGVVKGEKFLRFYSVVKEQLQKTKEEIISASAAILPGTVILDDYKDSPELIVVGSESFDAIFTESDCSSVEVTTITPPPCNILF